ncbi:hypothetical protein ACWKSP_40310 [Micromonosporaceae bacterium Da 78-11]
MPATSSSHNATDPSGRSCTCSTCGADTPGNAVAASPDAYASGSRRQ